MGKVEFLHFGGIKQLAGRATSATTVKLAFHDANTDSDILAWILADTSDTRDFLKLFLWQAERHADILATILARISVSVLASWNAGFTPHRPFSTML